MLLLLTARPPLLFIPHPRRDLIDQVVNVLRVSMRVTTSTFRVLRQTVEGGCRLRRVDSGTSLQSMGASAFDNRLPGAAFAFQTEVIRGLLSTQDQRGDCLGVWRN